MMMSAVTVLGAGSWGTALAIVLADNGHDVRLWTHRKEQAELINTTHKNEKYLEIMIPEKITAYDNLEESIQDAETIVIVVPTIAMRDVCRQLNNVLRHSVTIVQDRKSVVWGKSVEIGGGRGISMKNGRHEQTEQRMDGECG